MDRRVAGLALLGGTHPLPPVPGEKRARQVGGTAGEPELDQPVGEAADGREVELEASRAVDLPVRMDKIRSAFQQSACQPW